MKGQSDGKNDEKMMMTMTSLKFWNGLNDDLALSVNDAATCPLQ